MTSANQRPRGYFAAEPETPAAAEPTKSFQPTIDTVDELTQVIQSVSEGRIILNPAVMEGMTSANDPKSTFLKDLSPRETEVLSWMAKGYNNHTIADVLCLEPKTIERHINGIYNKLGTAPDSKHARVHAVTLLLRATGALPAEEFTEV